MEPDAVRNRLSAHAGRDYIAFQKMQSAWYFTTSRLLTLGG